MAPDSACLARRATAALGYVRLCLTGFRPGFGGAARARSAGVGPVRAAPRGALGQLGALGLALGAVGPIWGHRTR